MRNAFLAEGVLGSCDGVFAQLLLHTGVDVTVSKVTVLHGLLRNYNTSETHCTMTNKYDDWFIYYHQ